MRSLTVLALCLAAAAATRLPPILPIHFQGNFTEFTATLTAPPPFVNGIPQPPFKASRGHVAYDWEVYNLVEDRIDYCVNIFPTMKNDFPCTFHNINNVSYLSSTGAPHLPPCCVFGDPWLAPAPDFLRVDVNSTWVGTAPWDQGEADWWINTDIAPPAGPFLWSFRNGTASPQVYSSFSFPGIEGWIQQNFHNIDATKPNASVWELPASCKPVAQLPNCGFFGAQLPASWRAMHAHRRG